MVTVYFEPLSSIGILNIPNIFSIVNILNARYYPAMTRTSLDHHNCSFARTVDIIGDRWTLMILRDAFYGIRRFGDFKRRIGVTQAILSARLAHLVDHQLLEKAPVSDASSRAEYLLTDRGRDLFPAIVSLMQWGDRNIHKQGAPIELFDKANGKLVDTLEVQADGGKLEARDIGFKSGPGANSATIAEFDTINSK